MRTAERRCNSPPSTLPTANGSGQRCGRRPVGLLQQRLELVEDLWQTVLRSECPAGTERGFCV